MPHFFLTLTAKQWCAGKMAITYKNTGKKFKIIRTFQTIFYYQYLSYNSIKTFEIKLNKKLAAQNNYVPYKVQNQSIYENREMMDLEWNMQRWNKWIKSMQKKKCLC